MKQNKNNYLIRDGSKSDIERAIEKQSRNINLSKDQIKHKLTPIDTQMDDILNEKYF